jgi:Rv0078B-related antitoxin
LLMAFSDTSPEIEAMQLEIRWKMTPERRFQIALEISDLCRELRKAGIRKQHPGWSERQVMIELFRLAFLPEPLPTWVR